MFIELIENYLGQPKGERIDVSEADAKTLIESGKAKALSGNPIQDIITQNFEKSFNSMTEVFNKTLDNALQQFASDQSKSRKNATPAIFGENGNGDTKKNFGDWLLCVRRNDQKRLSETYNSHFSSWEGENEKVAMSGDSGATGGYTVPAEFVPRLLQLASENAVVRPRATTIPMSSRSVHIPTLDVTTAQSAGDTAMFGGLVARWTEEAATITETEPSFKQIELVAHELSGYSKISNALLADNAVGLESLLMSLFGRAIGWHEDYAFLRGNGVGKPQGALNAGALISVTRSAANAFDLEDAAGMIGRLLPGWDPMHTVWAIHPTVLVKLFQMNDAEGNIIFIDNARDRPQMVLFGIPVAVTEKLPALNTLGDVLLMDLQHYVVGDRQQIEIAFSEHVAFLNNQGTWRFVSRVDGQPWVRSAITLSDASSTLSPFVGLAAG